MNSQRNFGKIKLNNWRIYQNAVFSLPQDSFVICDENGSGKTSLISALYSLFTNKPWPATKFSSNLRFTKEYFGVSSENKEWFFSGKISATGRLSTRYSTPKDFKGPYILTYQPQDNYWLSSSRTIKLSTLDELLSQLYGEKYYYLIKELSKNVKSKQNILKHHKETLQIPEEALIKPINLRIFGLSKRIWTYRKVFLQRLEERLPIYSSWINSPLKDWFVDYQVVNFQGQRINFQQAAQTMDLNSKLEGDNQQLSKGEDNFEDEEVLTERLAEIWQKEIIVGKVLFGAQRDDFYLKSNNLLAENILSKGETRLLILFIKYVALLLLKDPQINRDEREVWWFLDDVYNEFDEKREKEIFQSILADVSYYISTATHKPAFADSIFSLKDLTKEK
jgi:recombinational DNA repair ATPase RecF